LALYLLSFVLVFAKRPPIPHAGLIRIQPFLVIPIAIFLGMFAGKAKWIGLPLHLLAFFVLAMVCHGELARRRPRVGQLTEYYLWISVGGVLGGAFNALLAPLLFSGPFEYPLAIAAACLCRPYAPAQSKRPNWGDAVWPAVALGLTAAMIGIVRLQLESVAAVIAVTAGFVVLAAMLLWFSERPVRFALGIVAVFFTAVWAAGASALHRERSFFGIYSVAAQHDRKDLLHGTTIHGSEWLDQSSGWEPRGYYDKSGPLGDLFARLPRTPGMTVGVAGLGIGQLACYARPGERWEFYEIDPAVIRMASDQRLFKTFAQCGADASVIAGDARIKLLASSPGKFDLIILDAFSSDSVPAHLLTREALDGYLRVLSPGGLLVVHVSNHFLNIKKVVAALLHENALAFRYREGGHDKHALWSQWIVAARTGTALHFLDQGAQWQSLPREAGFRVWTDDYSSLVDALRK
jgi:SAM-dependent methyltransferase/energy-converting hydrogenase Eha subunit A